MRGDKGIIQLNAGVMHTIAATVMSHSPSMLHFDGVRSVVHVLFYCRSTVSTSHSLYDGGTNFQACRCEDDLPDGREDVDGFPPSRLYRLSILWPIA